MICAPSSSSASLRSAFTAPCVPTGMKKGVSTGPWGVFRTPRRAPLASVLAISKEKLTPNSVSGENPRSAHLDRHIDCPNADGNEQQRPDAKEVDGFGQRHDRLGRAFRQKSANVGSDRVIQIDVTRSFQVKNQDEQKRIQNPREIGVRSDCKSGVKSRACPANQIVGKQQNASDNQRLKNRPCDSKSVGNPRRDFCAHRQLLFFLFWA